MKVLEIEIMIMLFFGVRQNIIVPNVSWGIANLHECDVLVLSNHNYAAEIEIKTSKADILADKKKKHGHRHNHIARLFFAVPESLQDFALKHIPERAGLIVVGSKDGVRWPRITKQCKRNKHAVEWTNTERMKLAHLGTMRVLGLKQRLLKG